MGEGESTRTAAEQFSLIAKKGSKATLHDVKDAFSVEKLSKAFFDQYKNHYDIFCEFMVKKPNIRQGIFNGDEKAIRDFNKKLLGRIVFLYFIQKKGWMGVPVKSKWGQGDFGFLTNLFKQHKNPDLFYSEILSKLFFDTLNTKRKDDIVELTKGQPCRIPYLNGGLFEEDDKKHRNIILNAKLFENLFNFFNQYNFTIYEDDPNDHTVAVDPEMLGHIFENLLEDNKDKGAFYSPKEIVHYMCQESFIEYLTTWFEDKGYEVIGYVGFDKPQEPRLFSVNEGRKGQMVLEADNKINGKQIDRSLIEKLLKKQLDDSDKKLVKQHAAEFHNALDNVKICDPAIGSGAFPMGLLQEIFTAKQTLYHFERGNLIGFPASDVKLNIIQNSIYGVDIEKGAVDIARLRFWLSLVVDEEEPKALPNLDYKIVVGNSLISKLGEEIIDIDWRLNETTHGLFGADLAKHKGELLRKINQEQKDFFNPNSDKKKLSADIRKLKIDLLINQLELMVTTKGIETKPSGTGKMITQQTEAYLKTLGWKDSIKQLRKIKEQSDKALIYFDWKLDFPEVMNEQVTHKVGFDIVIGNPPYVNFRDIKNEIEKNHYLSKFTTAEYQSDLYILFIEKGYSILKRNSGQFAFIIPNSVTNNLNNSRIRKFILDESNLTSIVNTPIGVFESATVDTVIICTTLNKKNSPINIYKLENKMFKQIESRSQSDFAENNNYDFDFLTDSKSKSILKKIRTNTLTLDVICNSTSGIKEYEVGKGKPPQTKKDCTDKVFNSKKKLNKFYREHVTGSEIDHFIIKYDGEYIKYGEWLAAPRDSYYFEPIEKIIIREIPAKGKLKVAFTDKGYTVKNTAHIFVPKEEFEAKYLCAVLNSGLMGFYFINNFSERDDVFPKAKIGQCRLLPIKVIDKKEQKSFSKLVEKIVTLKLQGKTATILEQQIDNMIFRLYDLTYDEVKVIDPDFALSKKEYEAIVV